MRKTWLIAASLAVVAVAPAPARAHELWFRVGAEGDPARVVLYFADAPEPGEAERVVEIARTRVWADGLPLEVERLPDGLETRLPARRPAVVSAFADRGVVDFEGDAFVIELAAYAQTKPIAAGEAVSLGLGDDQLRLLLVSHDAGPPVVRAVWKGKPAADVVVQVFGRPGAKPTELRTDARGEVPCPDLKAGPVALLAQVKEPTPGKRDGRDYSHTRFKATLTIGSEAGGSNPAPPR